MNKKKVYIHLCIGTLSNINYVPLASEYLSYQIELFGE